MPTHMSTATASNTICTGIWCRSWRSPVRAARCGRAARDVIIEGRRLRTLGSEDHLFHAIVHGMRISDVPPMRWIVDVATITSQAAAAGEPIDWLSVAEQAERAATAVPLARGLGFLLDSGILGERGEGCACRTGRSTPGRFAAFQRDDAPAQPCLPPAAALAALSPPGAAFHVPGAGSRRRFPALPCPSCGIWKARGRFPLPRGGNSWRSFAPTPRES